MHLKAPLLLVLSLLLRVFVAPVDSAALVSAAAVAAPGGYYQPAPIIDLGQLHLPQTPVEWGIFVGTCIAFVWLRRSDKRLIRRTVVTHVKTALLAAAKTPAPVPVVVLPVVPCADPVPALA
jgi:hypothetical protein